MANTKYNYRLIITKTNGKTVKLAGTNCHELKSLGGQEFHREDVQRVFVCDILGNHYLYLVKNDPSKTENVPSEYAAL